jgi:hypothetical protein
LVRSLQAEEPIQSGSTSSQQHSKRNTHNGKSLIVDSKKKDSQSFPDSSPSPTTSLSYSPSPQRIRDYLSETGNAVTRSLEIPPPPPDPFSLDVALETSKIPGHNVASNAVKVDSYMNQLERYLEVRTSIEIFC